MVVIDGVRRGLLSLTPVLLILLSLIIASPPCHGQTLSDLSGSVTVTTANERSTLDRVTRKITSTADVTIRNTSSQAVSGPLHAVITINSSQASQVTMPSPALGGHTSPPYNKYYYDLTSKLTNNILAPNGAVTFQVKFVRPSTVTFTYTVKAYGVLQAANVPPTANAGSNQTITLLPGQLSVNFTLDGSQSRDQDGTIASFRWTGTPDPADAQMPTVQLSAGTYIFTLVVTDNNGASSNPATVTITVLPPPNQAPVANAGSDRTITLQPGQLSVNFTLDGSQSRDQDGTIASFRWTGTPDPADVAQPTVALGQGTHTFTLVVTDDKNATSQPATVTITVRPAQPPQLSVNPLSYIVNQGQSLTINVSAVDPNGELVTLSAFPALKNAAFSGTPGVSANGVFAFTPDAGQSGIHMVSFKATDPTGLSDTKTVEISVSKVNHGPVLMLQASATVDEGAIIAIPVKATDPDGDIVTLTASGLPANALFIPSTGTITFAPDYTQAGTVVISVTASDGVLSDTKSVQVTVNNVPTGSAGQGGLVLTVDPVESPSFLTTQRITGSVNAPTQPPTPRLKSALITSLVPAVAEQGTTLNVLLTGNAGDYPTHFTNGVSKADFGAGITVTSLSVTGPGQATAVISIDPNAAEGPRSISVVTGAETAVSVLAFNVMKGKTRMTGRIVDAETGQAIPGATVTVKGSTITAVTDGNGYFILENAPAGQQVLLVYATDHQLIEMPISAGTGSAQDLGNIKTESTVFNPNAPSSASIGSLLHRGINNETRIKSPEEARQLVKDAVLSVGGEDIGLLDDYGNQENPNIPGKPFMSLGKDAIETLAMRTLSGESRSLGELLHSFTVLWQWQNGPPKLKQWIQGIQNVVNRAWNNPNDPQNALFILLFNPGGSLASTPPQIVPDLRLNALQAHLAELTLLLSATRTVDPKVIHDQVVAKYPELAWSFDLRRASVPMLAQSGGEPPSLTPVARAERTSYSGQSGKKILLRAEDVGYSPVGLTYSWTVLEKPAGSTSASLLENDDQKICYFTGDSRGDYVIRLVVRAGDKVSAPFDFRVNVDDPCIWGEERSWKNADASWNSVLCNFANQVPLTYAQQIPATLFANFLEGTTPLDTFDAKLKAADNLKTFLDLNDFKASQSKITAASVYSQHYPDILKEANSNTTKFSAFKTFAVNQLVEGMRGFVEGQISQVAKDLMYGILDKMIDKYIDSLRPASPFIRKTEVVDIEGINRKGVLVTFERSPGDRGESEGGTWHFYYMLWRYSANEMTRLFIGKEGKLPGPLASPDNKDVLTYLDPSPPEGQCAYYVQARRIMGGPVINEEWNEGQFFVEFMLNTVQPPYANVYTHVKTFSDKVLYFYKALKLQDSDLSEPARLYVPKALETPPPPVSLASTKEFGPYNGDVLISMPIFNSLFRLRGTRMEYLLSCGFKDPYQVGLATDFHGNIYSDNSASDAMFGGRIFRWKPYSLERELFGSVQYFSQLLLYAKPCAVQGLTSGWVGSSEKLFIADLYSNKILELEIPGAGVLPPNPNHYVSQPVPMPEGLVLGRNTSMAVNSLKGELLVTAGDNIFRYDSVANNYLFPETAKPFIHIVGVDADRFGTLYITDGQSGTITAIPSDKQNSLFYQELITNPATRSLFTLKSNINSPGELRLSGDHRSIVWFDHDGYHNRVFGISARVIDLQGNPLAGARVSCSDRGEVRSALTDQYGVFHLPGLLLEGFPLQMGLLIRSADGRSGTYIAKMRDRGETFIPELLFVPDTLPSGTVSLPTQPSPVPPVSVSIPLPPAWDPVFEIDRPELPPPPVLPGTTSPRAPRVEIVTPVDGKRLNQDEDQILGYVDDPSVTQAVLTMNGIEETVSVQDHLFRKSISLRPGVNHIQAKATVFSGGEPLTGISKPVLVFRINESITAGTISGIIRERSTGYPVPDALIRIQGTNLEAYANELGIWSIREVPLGTVTVEIIP